MPHTDLTNLASLRPSLPLLPSGRTRGVGASLAGTGTPSLCGAREDMRQLPDRGPPEPRRERLRAVVALGRGPARLPFPAWPGPAASGVCLPVFINIPRVPSTTEAFGWGVLVLAPSARQASYEAQQTGAWRGGAAQVRGEGLAQGPGPQFPSVKWGDAGLQEGSRSELVSFPTAQPSTRPG